MNIPTLIGDLPAGRTAPRPVVTAYLPEHNPGRFGMITRAGGGYGGRSAHEGEGMARHFSAAGIACFDVAYRIGPEGFHHPAMLEDALAAMAAVRARADDFGIAPDRIGILGCSAGGHLAAHACTAWSDYPSAVPLRPDFGVLCYPVILSEAPHAHEGSMRTLLGDYPAPEQRAAVSCDRLVRADTPPCFLWHTGNDLCVPVENSLAFAAALRRHAVPFELHVYQADGHGLGLNTPLPWAVDALRWITAVATRGEM